jgi:hypothetical protein
MTAIGYVVRTMVVKLLPQGGVEASYECAITGVTEVPTQTTVTTQTACPDGAAQDVGPTTWALDVAYNVDHAPDSFHRVLRDNAGVPAVLTITPDPTGNPGTKIEYTVPALVPGGAGMVVGAYAVATVSLPLSGAPVYVDAP